MSSNEPYGTPYPPANAPGSHGVPDYVPTPPPIAAPLTKTASSRSVPPVPPKDDDPSTVDVAKGQAADVAGGAADAAKNVAGVAKDQASQVTAEAGRQAKQLWGQAQSELSDQAQTQQDRLAGGLHSLGDQLHSMAEGAESPGMAADLAHQGADRAHQVADWFEKRDPGSVLDEVRSYARQRPGMFLAIALGAGLLAGRLARNLAADPDELAAENAQDSIKVQDGRSTTPPPAQLGAHSAAQLPAAEWGAPR